MLDSGGENTEFRVKKVIFRAFWGNFRAYLASFMVVLGHFR